MQRVACYSNPRTVSLPPSLEALEGRLLLAAPDLAILSVDATFANDPIVPGDKGVVHVQLGNLGDLAASGSLTLEVRASIDTAFEDHDPLLGVRTMSGNLAPGDNADISVNILVPATALPNSYYVLVKVTSTLDTPDSNASNDVGASSGAAEVFWVFGAVGTRKNVRLKVDDGAGLVTFALRGPGSGTVTPGGVGSFNSVTITGSTMASSLSITTTAGHITAVDTISVLDSAGAGTGSIKGINARNADLDGSLTVDGLLGSLTLHDISSSITLNDASVQVPDNASVAITAHSLSGSTINTGGIAIKSFKAAQVSGASITAPWIGSMTVRSKAAGEGNLTGSTLTLDDSNAKGMALTRLQVSGAMDGTNITTYDSAGSIAAGSWNGGSLDADDVKKIKIARDMSAGIFATEIGSIAIGGDFSGNTGILWTRRFQVGGDVSSAAIDMGYLDNMTVKGWIVSSSVLVDSEIGSITVGGMRDAKVLAGVNGADLPTSAAGFNAGDPGWIGKITIKGMRDAGGARIDSYVNSSIAAWTIGNATLADMLDTGSTFGLTAHSMGKYSRMENGAAALRGGWTGSGNPLDSQVMDSSGNFAVTIVGGP